MDSSASNDLALLPNDPLRAIWCLRYYGDMERKGSATVGMAAVAKRAGVTKATVSKVLGPESHRYRITAQTREKVEAAARELGYALDWRASHRARQRSRHVGLLMEWRAPFTTGAYEQSLEHFAAALLRHDYDLLIVPDVSNLADWERQRHDQRLDGIIALQPTADSVRAFVANPGVPAVVLNQPLPVAIDQVVADDAGGMRLAVKHLAESGHRRLLYVDGDTTNAHPSRAERRTAATATAREFGLALTVTSPSLPATSFTIEGQPVTAVLTYSHAEIPTVLAHLRQRRIAIGRDVAVVAGTDISAWTFMDPPLSAIDIQMGVMISRAIDLLMQRIAGAGPDKAQRIKVAQRLHVRASSAAPLA